jgi:hypothetical protein
MIASWLFRRELQRFRAACGNPRVAQAAQLRRILAAAASTELGVRHDFARLARIADPLAMMRAFQRDVPIRTHKEMADDLEAVYTGRWQSVCPSPPLWFAMTAGSTGRFKYIPVTREYRREISRSAMIFNGALEDCFPEIRRLKTQFLVGSAEGGRSPGGVPQGFASGFNYKNLPWFVRRRFVMPYWAFTIDDPEERSYAAGRMLMDERQLGVLTAISPVNLINVRQALDRNVDRLIGDVAAGTLTIRGAAAVPGAWSGRPDRRRAQALHAAWHATGTLPPEQLFPALRVLVCWRGGNMSYYLDDLRSAFGIDQTFEFPISASEGVFALPVAADRRGGALAVTTHVLEFLPEEGGAALRADELEVGREYRIVVTNGGGLYRYDMEDIVRVTSFFRATPVIEFVSKKDHQISVSNERLTELDVTLAMQEATRRCGRRFPEFLFVPCSDRRYRVVVDAASCGDGAALETVAQAIEQELRVAAKGYDFEREDALLAPLQLVVAERGQLRAWLERRQGQALPNAQIKPLHLTNEFNAHRAFTAMATYAA